VVGFTREWHVTALRLAVVRAQEGGRRWRLSVVNDDPLDRD
jgi:hypothetical protein